MTHQHDESAFRKQYEAKRSLYVADQRILEAFVKSAVDALNSPQPGKPAIRCKVDSFVKTPRQAGARQG